MPKRNLKINAYFLFHQRSHQLKNYLQVLILKFLSNQRQFSSLKNSQKLRRQNWFRNKNLKKLRILNWSRKKNLRRSMICNWFRRKNLRRSNPLVIKTLRGKKEGAVKLRIETRSNSKSQAFHQNKIKRLQHQKQNQKS